MTDVRELVLDLRTHALDAPAHCRALMRRAANLLETRVEITGSAEIIVEGLNLENFRSKEQADAQG